MRPTKIHLKIPAETLIEFSNKYVALFEQLTGLEFEKPDPSVSVRARIRDALASELPGAFLNRTALSQRFFDGDPKELRYSGPFKEAASAGHFAGLPVERVGCEYDWNMQSMLTCP
jgi:hypothetical protein